MNGIDLNRPILYRHASMRFFEENEYHINRTCQYDVLLLVYQGILRFREDGIDYAIGPGEYHIQRHGSVQSGIAPSDSPKYLYVHFLGQWTSQSTILSRSGSFDIHQLIPRMEEMDRLAHGDYTAAERTGCFLSLLAALYRRETQETVAARIAGFLETRLQSGVTLEQLSEEFHFSKNHVINLFRQSYGTTPTAYLNSLRLQKAKHLLEATSDPLEAIAAACGFHSYSHFYRLFLRETHTSPTKWREQKRLEP